MYSLRQLEGHLQKVVTITSSEIEQDDSELRGKYIFRDDDGYKHLWSPHPQSYQFHTVETVAEADQISFRCPACFSKNGGPRGTHHVMVTFAGRDVPEDAGSRDSTGKPSRWNASGNTIDDLVLTPSILLDANLPPDQGCHWHGFVGSNGILPGHAG